MAIRSRGTLCNRVPNGATSVKYEVFKGSKRLLVDYKKAIPILKENGQLHRKIRSKNGYNKVIFTDLEENPLSRAERKFLFRLRPWNYFAAGSNPKVPVRVRATLQGSRYCFDNLDKIKDICLTRLRQGQEILEFYKLLKSFICQRRMNTDPNNFYDLLEERYAHWVNREIGDASQCLSDLGLTSLDLSNPLLEGSFRLAKEANLITHPQRGSVSQLL